MKYHLITFYLEYYSDFITVESYASYHGLDTAETRDLLDIGKTQLEQNAYLYKQTGTNYFANYVKRNNLKQYERFI